MKRHWIRRGLLPALLSCTCFFAFPADSPLKHNLSGLPLCFIENKGQYSSPVLFALRSADMNIFLQPAGLSYYFSNSSKGGKPVKPVGLELQGANPFPEISGENKSGYFENYYTLPGRPEGITKAYAYERIVYKNIYPSIDWVVYTKDGKLKYDFIVHPGGDPSRIKIRYTHTKRIRSHAGNIEIMTPLGSLTEHMPVSFQENRQIETHYSLKGNTIGYSLGAYDKNKVLTIDPFVMWATYYGGNDEDLGGSVSIDPSGNIFVVGVTASIGLSYNGFRDNMNTASNCAILIKFDKDGQRIWATYYGNPINFGSNDFHCAADHAGNIYLSGSSHGIGIEATPNGFQPALAGEFDAFLVKFDAGGIRQWGTFYGGERDDFGIGITVDSHDDIYLSGVTASSTGIAAGGFSNTRNGGKDAFLVKFSSNGNRLWATYYGGTADDEGFDVAVDNTDNVYLAGTTESVTRINANGFQPSPGGGIDIFLVKFDEAGNRLWATYCGGSDDEKGSTSTSDGTSRSLGPCLATDNGGNVFLAGNTISSSGFISGNFHNTYSGACDAFLAKYNSAGQQIWSTYFGNSGADFAYDVAVDSTGNAYLVGETRSTSGIASGGIKNTYGGGDADGFMAKFDPNGSRIWSGYYGSSGYDNCHGACIDGQDNLFITGGTSSTDDIASSNAFQPQSNGSYEIFLAKIIQPYVAIDKTLFTETHLCAWPFLFDLPYISKGLVENHFILTVELSDANGNFVSHRPINIGPVTKASGSIPCLLAYSLPPGDGYKIRIYVIPFSSLMTFPDAECSVSVGNYIRIQIDTAICSNQSFQLGSQAITQSGTYTQSFNNGTGCDSIVTLNLTVSPVVQVTDELKICSSQLPVQWNGITIPAGATTNPSYTSFHTNTAGGCDSTVVLQLTVDAGPQLDAGENILAKAGDIVMLNASASGSGLSYTWQPATGLDNPMQLKPSLTVSRDQLYTLTVTDSYGCSASDEVSVKVDRPIPNVFSPNGDGVHDKWEMPSIAVISSCTVDVFNRYGQRVFHSSGYNNPWDGTMNGKPLPAGAYYYVITIPGAATIKGDITILR